MSESTVRRVTLHWVHTSDLHGNMFMYDDLTALSVQTEAIVCKGSRFLIIIIILTVNAILSMT